MMKELRLVYILILMFILPVYYSYGQDSVVMNLKKHIYYLSSDKLQGRLTGSKGEKKASDYIIRQYKEIGILPMGFQGSFLQTFSIRSGKKPVGKNQLVINTHKLTLNQDYYPLNASSDGKIKGSVADVGYGIAAPAINYDSYKSQIDLKGKIFLMEAGTPDGQDPHSKYGRYADVKSKVEAAVAKGAIGIIFTNSNDQSDEPDPSLNIRSFQATIPVIFIKSNALKEARRDQLNVAEITVHLEKISVTGHNVIGFLDNHAPATIVIGAHYDHLGRNELGGSLFRGEPEIHNGADDNASGTAGVIELARWLASNGITEKNNFLFINFSGEEEGLHGSKSWLSHATYDTSKINFMINMDMIGRYGSEKGLQIDGLGTSPDAFGFIRTTSFDSLKLRFSDNGIGPSDHTSFYLENIPVLFFFTGYQEDYHKPTDDADKINYSGERDILRFIQHLIMELDKKGTLRFSKTKSTGNEEIPQFKVRLGIVPDYSFEGNGLRVDGVDEGEPASKAGILKGDVIISLGDYSVTDIYAYMHALAAHKKGDTAPVKILRNSQEIQLKVTF